MVLVWVRDYQYGRDFTIQLAKCIDSVMSKAWIVYTSGQQTDDGQKH